MMTSYSERTGRKPSFEVLYHFLGSEDGGRKAPPHQHTRWDFLYDGDDLAKDSIWMIWPEIVGPDGEIFPEGEVPLTGRALMYIVNLENEPYHRNRISVGTKGYFVEGPHKFASCEVVAMHGLAGYSRR